MAEQDPNQLVVAGTGDLYVAALGAALPTDEDTVLTSIGYQKLGYVTEDGLSFSWEPNVEDFMAWQSRSPIRRELTGQDYTLTFQLEQWNTKNMQVAFGGGAASTISAGHYRFDFLSDADQLGEFTVVADWKDGTKQFRLVLPRANATEGSEIQLQRSALAILPVSFKALAPGGTTRTAYMLTDSAGFVPAGS